MQATTAVAAELILAADFTRTGDRAHRLAQEVRHFARGGKPPALLQTRLPKAGECIAPSVLACLRREEARILRPDQATKCDVLVLHEAALAQIAACGLDQLSCREAYLVCHTVEDVNAVAEMHLCARRKRPFVTNPFLEPESQVGRTPLPIWTPVVSNASEFSRLKRRRERPAMIWLAAEHSTEPPEALTAFGADVLTFGADREADGVPMDLSLDRLLDSGDLFILAPDHPLRDLPDTLIASALSAGKPVLLPSLLKSHYGKGPRYYGSASLAAESRAALASAGRRRRVPDFVIRCQTGPASRLCDATPSLGTASAPRRETRRPVLMLPSNGVGVGHLTRLLAVARRMDRPVVFGSQAPALDVIRHFGFHADYIPSHALVHGAFEAWDAWFGAEIARLLDRHDPALVVYDGNHPSNALVSAVTGRPDCGLAWMRRGMWARTSSRFLKNARWCDIVIEPGELAGARDNGVTSRLRHQATAVEPIRLLDPEDLLDRRAAARALQLDPDHPIALVQLGSGFNRDLLTILDHIVGVLSQHKGLQIVVAEWVTGSIPLNLWANVQVLRGFPISRYFRAFDFCVSAAGYNSFHELIGFQVPTIFVANQHASMDDQYGRAKFAQDNSAAFEISEVDLSDLPDLVAMLMQPEARGFLADRCKELCHANGAVAAVQALETLILERSGASNE